MKKNIIKYLLLVISLFLVFLTPRVFAEESVFVEEITLVDHSVSATEKSAPTKDGLNIGFDLSFSFVNDFAKYKIVVNNPTDTSYELNKNIDFRSSDYLEYKTEFEGDNNIIDGHQKLNFFVTITYKNEVPSTMLTEGKLIENNTLSLNLSNDNVNSVMNPSTVDRVILYVITLIITSGFSLVFYRITKNKKYLSIFVLGLVLIPFEAYALEKLEFKIDTKVVIEEKHSIYYFYYNTIKTSEKQNYLIYRDDYCSTIGDSGYEYCFVAYKDPVLHAKGDEVTLLTNIESTYINEQGELSTQTLYFNGEPQEFIDYDRIHNEFYLYDFEVKYGFEYNFVDGDDTYDNIFNNDSIVYLDSTNYAIHVKAPTSFIMQNHDMYYHLVNVGGIK